MKIIASISLLFSLCSCVPNWWIVREEAKISNSPESKCVINALNSIDGVQVISFQETHNYFFMSDLGRGELHIEKIDGNLFVTSNFNGKGKKTPKAIKENGPILLQKINQIVVQSCASRNKT